MRNITFNCAVYSQGMKCGVKGGGGRPLTRYIHIHMIKQKPVHASSDTISPYEPSLEEMFYFCLAPFLS